MSTQEQWSQGRAWYRVPEEDHELFFNLLSEWPVLSDSPDYWTELDAGKLRLEVKPGPEHEWHDEWRDRLMRGEASYGAHGPPHPPPFKLHPPWDSKNMVRDHPYPYYFVEDSPKKLWLEEQAKLKDLKKKKKKKPQGQQEQTSEAGPSQQNSTSTAKQANHDTSRSSTRGSRAQSIPPSPPTESSNPGTQPSTRDKGKGKAVDPLTSTESTAAPVTGPSHASAPASLSASVSASTSTVAGPSIANPHATTSTTTGATTGAANHNTTIIVNTATASKEESSQDAVANAAKEKSTASVKGKPIKIKLIPPGNKKDIKGKGKAVDKPSNTNNNSNKITKHKGSKKPVAVATHIPIKRSQVVKGKYWVFKLDPSMFTEEGSIREEFRSGKGKGELNASSSSANDKGKGNGEGSSSTASSSKTATASNNGIDNSGDELALGRDSDDSNSSSETDDSKDSDFTITTKPKKGKGTTTAATTTEPKPNTITTTASSSQSSSSKRKRTTDDTGDEERNTYYVLRCPLGNNCMTQSSSTHNAPASMKGVFCRHPFKKRRAMDHIERCGLDGELNNEEEIWRNCCLKVIPDRINTPVNDEWAVKHNRTVVRSLVHKAGGGKREKKMLEEEMEEEL
ncbi:hypothetical protein QBC32DRAFT_380777 [Pseudoneurospora amorphoporcata]|uniref:Uncharacterized protein n=1 Tax=Pseudoneurospora amorphoporcata TaxID=241081 RepID=A0AAN6SCJ1_9PEZI|nr:hypothetical protein QBC32DRAFT_380777 [Pseudoneurospora amorphoporcata]